MRVTRAAAVLLLVATIIIAGAIVRQFRSARNSVLLAYTGTVKKRDIVDAARNSLAALTDAEFRAENYILTGETVYSEAYQSDVHTWEDESGTLQLIAEKDTAAVAAADFVTAGKRTMDELAAIVSAYEKNGQNPALERIRKSSAIVYLDQARAAADDVLRTDGGAGDGTRQMMNRAFVSFTRLAEGAGVLSCLSLISAILLFWLETRRA